MLRAWFLAEAGAVHDHDMFLADQFFHEDLIALGNVDARIGVERSARGNATDAGRRLAPFLGEIAARAQFPLNFDEMVLWTFQSSLDRILFGMVGAEARTQQTMHSLGVGLECCGFAGDDTPSDAPSGDEVILRHSTTILLGDHAHSYILVVAKTEFVAFRVAPDLKRELQRISDDEQRALSQVCEMLLYEGVEAYKKEGPKFIQRLVAKQKARVKDS